MMSFVVAMEQNRVIGKDNKLPWHLPADLAYFKKVTTGHTIIMGRKTYESIGRPLPNRRNVILTRDPNFYAEGCDIVHSPDEIVKLCNGDGECFVIGGSELFSLLWNEVDRLYVTYIDANIPGDTFFPEIDESKWQLCSARQGKVDEKNRYAHEFRIYERKN
ncbi:dihydrofolate reductase [bacterium LRH843]|nr:dihydrofolate reductase [bacterium LRH843]